ncbi:unnamed protein product [Danaus chrysippus]|uniref:(African queen) hypothetical protein n=1 Tax=Danaus chrysippus TaxID=151541 RepID=A0A8J2M901_9NEOP|nr:unnamed protein product [Danaus chrysippus]
MESEAQDSTSNVIQTSRKSLYMIFKESPAKNLDDKVSFMENKLREMMKCPRNEFQTLGHDLRHFKSDLKKRWVSCNYIEDRFMKKNERWLSNSIPVHTWKQNTKPGRPSKDFQELTDRSKRRKTKQLREEVPVEVLTFAASVSQNVSGNAAASKLIKDATSSPTRAKRYRKVINTTQEPKIKKYTSDEALRIFIEGGFRRKQWELQHKSTKDPFISCLRKLNPSKSQPFMRETIELFEPEELDSEVDQSTSLAYSDESD